MNIRIIYYSKHHPVLGQTLWYARTMLLDSNPDKLTSQGYLDKESARKDILNQIRREVIYQNYSSVEVEELDINHIIGEELVSRVIAREPEAPVDVDTNFTKDELQAIRTLLLSKCDALYDKVQKALNSIREKERR